MRAVVRAGWAAVRRRRLQSLVIAAVVLLSSGTALLALGLLVASSAPFDRAFTYQRGAHATVSFDAAKVNRADLAATTDRPGVTAAEPSPHLSGLSLAEQRTAIGLLRALGHAAESLPPCGGEAGKNE